MVHSYQPLIHLHNRIRIITQTQKHTKQKKMERKVVIMQVEYLVGTHFFLFFSLVFCSVFFFQLKKKKHFFFVLFHPLKCFEVPKPMRRLIIEKSEEEKEKKKNKKRKTHSEFNHHWNDEKYHNDRPLGQFYKALTYMFQLFFFFGFKTYQLIGEHVSIVLCRKFIRYRIHFNDVNDTVSVSYHKRYD